PVHPQAETGHMAGPTSQRAFSLHADTRVLDKSDRMLVLNPARSIAQRSVFRQRARTDGTHRRLHRQLQRERPSIHLDQKRRASETAQTMFRDLTILGTRWLTGGRGELSLHTIALNPAMDIDGFAQVGDSRSYRCIAIGL